MNVCWPFDFVHRSNIWCHRHTIVNNGKTKQPSLAHLSRKAHYFEESTAEIEEEEEIEEKEEEEKE